MPHTYSRVWIHAVFATKNRRPFLHKSIRAAVHELIRRQLADIGCSVEGIGGIEDHVHLLFLLPPQRSISEVLKQVKGGSSHEVNRSALLRQKFAWQVGYGAFSVSESQVERVRQYIRNQEEHHRRLTFQDEFTRFLQHHGLTAGEDGQVREM
ncbi:IS200/IS605 family transposase [Larkinella soli]|uniref:IS200/IS605 family transposase n=1 Tax=Larkinella soli TaxID=1770527 RepID=UPI000FFC8715|nr:IS200/IS605 family transposase [Larkinella soli]